MKLQHLAAFPLTGKPYREFFRTDNLSVGLYRLGVGATDTQSPHNEEEIYYVIAGTARFRCGPDDVAVSPGDVLFVAANEPHDFYDIRQDLELLVVFAPPESG